MTRPSVNFNVEKNPYQDEFENLISYLKHSTKPHLVPHLAAFPFLLLLLLFCAFTSVFAGTPQTQQPLFHVLLLLPTPFITKKQKMTVHIQYEGFTQQIAF